MYTLGKYTGGELYAEDMNSGMVRSEPPKVIRSRDGKKWVRLKESVFPTRYRWILLDSRKKNRIEQCKGTRVTLAYYVAEGARAFSQVLRAEREALTQALEGICELALALSRGPAAGEREGAPARASGSASSS